jgi:hypothetical protein
MLQSLGEAAVVDDVRRRKHENAVGLLRHVQHVEVALRRQDQPVVRRVPLRRDKLGVKPGDAGIVRKLLDLAGVGIVKEYGW